MCCEEPVVNEHFNSDIWHVSDEYSYEDEVQFYDDISGAPLLTELVMKAIEEEMAEYQKH